MKDTDFSLSVVHPVVCLPLLLPPLPPLPAADVIHSLQVEREESWFISACSKSLQQYARCEYTLQAELNSLRAKRVRCG